MNAVPKKQAQPPTRTALEYAQAQHERQLILVQRAANSSRTAIVSHRAQGDVDGEASARREAEIADAKIKHLLEAIDIDKGAIQAVRARDREAEHATALRDIEKLVGDTRRDIEALEGSLIAFARAYKNARLAIDSVDALMRRSGVATDDYILRAKLRGITEIALHLETEGLFGLARTLDTPLQLRQNKRGCLKHAAAEFEALTMRRVKTVLNIGSKPHEAA